MLNILNILIATFALMSVASIFLLIKCARMLGENDRDIIQLEDTCKMLNQDINAHRGVIKDLRQKNTEYGRKILDLVELIKKFKHLEELQKELDDLKSNGWGK